MNLDRFAPKIARRDKAAFGELYEETRRLVFAVCLGIVKDRGVAEEVMQETFVTVWTETPKFRGHGYKTWILTVAKNKSINTLRKRKRETPFDFLENENVGGGYSLDLDTGIVLRTALETLSDTDRQIVLLRNEGVKAKEIATIVGLPRGTVSWRYAEALKKLKQTLEGKR